MLSITIGDWSDDGHGKTEIFILDVDLTTSEVEELYTKATTTLGFDLKQYCKDYEDNRIPQDILDPVLSALDASQNDLGIEDWEISGGDYYLNPSTYFAIWLAMVNHKSDNPIREVVTPPDIKIGGYGLFYA